MTERTAVTVPAQTFEVLEEPLTRAEYERLAVADKDGWVTVIVALDWHQVVENSDDANLDYIAAAVFADLSGHVELHSYRVAGADPRAERDMAGVTILVEVCAHPGYAKQD